jgi:uncharacterized protein with HEPN domain
MREKPRDKERLIHIIEAIDNIFEFVEGKSFVVYKQDKKSLLTEKNLI